MIFEQNMPESSESTGRLVKRKHTLGLQQAIMSLEVSWGGRRYSSAWGGAARSWERLKRQGSCEGSGSARERLGEPGATHMKLEQSHGPKPVACVATNKIMHAPLLSPNAMDRSDLCC